MTYSITVEGFLTMIKLEIYDFRELIIEQMEEFSEADRTSLIKALQRREKEGRIFND